ncbi:MAG TPA: DUF2092 domain-containing protein [Candidatus Binatia bacterium]
MYATGLSKAVRLSLAIIWIALLGAISQPKAFAADAAAIDPRATELLKKMSDYLANLKQFSVRGATTMEYVLDNGQKIQFTSASDVFVQRPNHARANRVGDVTAVDFFYDGSTISLFGKQKQYYATAPAPPTLDEMLDHIRTRLGMEPPAADLLYSDVYNGLMADVTEARYVSPSVVGDTKTHHLAFRGKDVDFQIWIEDGDRPLPRKYLIVTKGTKGEPEFGVELSNWNVSPKIDVAMFKFTPPANATKVEFLPPKEIAAAKQR